MADRWNFINIFHPNSNILDSILERLNNQLDRLKNSNPLTDFYITRYYDRSPDQYHLRIGLKKPYSENKIADIIDRIEEEITSSTDEATTRSDEREDVEELKSLATDIKKVSQQGLGRIAKLAYVIHHYLNSSRVQVGDGVNEGNDLRMRNPLLYETTKTYLKEAQAFLAMLYLEWERLSSEQQT